MQPCNNPTHPQDLPHGEACFSFFRAPIHNTVPYKAITLHDAYRYIRGAYAHKQTAHLRTLTDAKAVRSCKATWFDYCTFSGTFSRRSDSALLHHSGLLCVDFDHVDDCEVLFEALLTDGYFETQLLFRSPSGDGLKWIIPIDLTHTTHADYFGAVAHYIHQTYRVEVDRSGRDLSRACFLPHDPHAYINPLILQNR